MVFFLLAFHVDFQVSIFTVGLGWHGDIEFLKSQPDSLQILLVLHAIDKVPTNHIGLVRKGIIGTVRNIENLMYEVFQQVLDRNLAENLKNVMKGKNSWKFVYIPA